MRFGWPEGVEGDEQYDGGSVEMSKIFAMQHVFYSKQRHLRLYGVQY